MSFYLDTPEQSGMYCRLIYVVYITNFKANKLLSRFRSNHKFSLVRILPLDQASLSIDSRNISSFARSAWIQWILHRFKTRPTIQAHTVTIQALRQHSRPSVHSLCGPFMIEWLSKIRPQNMLKTLPLMTGDSVITPQFVLRPWMPKASATMEGKQPKRKPYASPVNTDTKPR